MQTPNDIMEKFHFAHGAHFFLYNPQLVFFGYPSYLLKYTSSYHVNLLVDSWLGEIDRDFDHVLILERVDTSLALMMIKFCWSIDDIVHLKVNYGVRMNPDDLPRGFPRSGQLTHFLAQFNEKIIKNIE